MYPDKDWQNIIFEAFAKRSRLVVSLFKYIYLAIIIVLLSSTYVIFSGNPLFDLVYEGGKKSGDLALLMLGIIVLPGILGRFGIEIRITRIITLFRRQLGITTFFLGFLHFSVVRGLQYLSGNIPFKPPFALFELMGSFSLFLMFFIFLTSNNWSIKKLGKFWKVLHRVVYIILWLLVLHVGLQKISVWTIYIFVFALLEIVSWIRNLF